MLQEPLLCPGHLNENACKVLTQVANTGSSPFDGLFLGRGGQEYSDEVRIAMLREEAKEYGLIPDDSFDATTMPQDVLEMLGVTADEAAI